MLVTDLIHNDLTNITDTVLKANQGFDKVLVSGINQIYHSSHETQRKSRIKRFPAAKNATDFESKRLLHHFQPWYKKRYKITISTGLWIMRYII